MSANHLGNEGLMTNKALFMKNFFLVNSISTRIIQMMSCLLLLFYATENKIYRV